MASKKLSYERAMMHRTHLLAGAILVVSVSSCSCRKEPSEPPAPPAPAAQKEALYVVASIANLRAEPSAQAELVGKVRIGKIVDVLETRGEWRRVWSRSGVGEGWVLGSLLQKEKPSAAALREQYDAASARDVKLRRSIAERLAALEPKGLHSVERLLRALAHDPDESGAMLAMASKSYGWHTRRTHYPLTPSQTWARDPAVVVKRATGESVQVESLQAAVNNAKPGTVIHLPQGVYTRALRLHGKEDLTLLAPRGPAYFLIDDPAAHIIDVRDSKRVALDSLFLRHASEPVSGSGAAGVFVQNSTDVVVRNAWLGGSATWGVLARDSLGVIVSGSIIERYRASAVHLEGETQALVQHSLLRHVPEAVTTAKLAAGVPKSWRRIVRSTALAKLGDVIATDVLLTVGTAPGARTLLQPVVDDDLPTPEGADFSWAPDPALLAKTPIVGLSKLPSADCATANDEGIAFLPALAHWQTIHGGDIGGAYTFTFAKSGDLCRDGAPAAQVIVAHASYDVCTCKCDADSIEQGVLFFLLAEGRLELLERLSTPLVFAKPPFDVDGGVHGGWDPYRELGVTFATSDRELLSLRRSTAPPDLGDPRKKLKYSDMMMDLSGMDLSGMGMDLDGRPGEPVEGVPNLYRVVGGYDKREPSGVVVRFLPDVPTSFSAGDVQAFGATPPGSWACVNHELPPEATVTGAVRVHGEQVSMKTYPRGAQALDDMLSAYNSGAKAAREYAGYDTPGRTKEELVTTLPVFFWTDAFEQSWRCEELSWKAPEYAEPLIYLYAPAPTDVLVVVDDPVEVTVSSPAHGDGWSVRTREDGRLELSDSGLVVPSLFWEGENGFLPLRRQGYVLHRSEVLSFLDDALAERGLVPHEIDDFVTYWLPRLTSSPYVFVTFLDPRWLDEQVPVRTLPLSDTTLRVHLDWRPLDGPDDNVEPPLLDAPAERSGLTLVEWSGIRRAPDAFATALRDGGACRMN